jgi:hypothetical protein
LLFSKVGQVCLYGYLKDCIERKIRTILEKKHKRKQVMSSNHSTHWSEELYVTSGHYANMEQIAFNQSLPHMKEKSFTKTDELPSSL